jgi:hypothetical protein
MDKVDFIRIAPTYYYAAVATSLRRNVGHFTIKSLQDEYSPHGEDYLRHEELIKFALDKLVVEGAISELSDPFGDSLYQKTELFDQVIQGIEADSSGPYYKNKTAKNSNEWMRGALFRVNDQYQSLGIRPEDFTIVVPDDWSPIQINPNDQIVRDAVHKLQQATTAIEQDNGYAATFSEERDYVVQDLKSGLDKLKSDTVSIGVVRRTVVALQRASFRFANTVKGQMIDGALAAVKDVIKHHIGTALEYLLSLWP